MCAESSEKDTHSFVLRLWAEETIPDGWRGHVTHVPSGIRKNLQSFEELNDFIRTTIQPHS